MLKLSKPRAASPSDTQHGYCTDYIYVYTYKAWRTRRHGIFLPQTASLQVNVYLYSGYLSKCVPVSRLMSTTPVQKIHAHIRAIHHQKSLPERRPSLNYEVDHPTSFPKKLLKWNKKEKKETTPHSSRAIFTWPCGRQHPQLYWWSL